MQSSRRSREKDERTLLHFDTHRLVLVSTNFIITIIQVLYFFWCVLSFAFPILSPFSAAPSLKRAENRPRWVAVPLFFAQNFPLCLYPRSVRARGGVGGQRPTRVFVFWVAVVLGFRGMDVRTASPGVRIGAPHCHAERWDHLGGQDDLGHDEKQDDTFPLTTFPSVFPTDLNRDFLDFSQRGIFSPREIFSWPPNQPHSCRGGGVLLQ